LKPKKLSYLDIQVEKERLRGSITVSQAQIYFITAFSFEGWNAAQKRPTNTNEITPCSLTAQEPKQETIDATENSTAIATQKLNPMTSNTSRW